jgi:hypothetical protein
MIVYDAMFVLCSVDQAVCAQLVDQTGCSAGEAVNVVDGLEGEYIPICAGVFHMSADVRLYDNRMRLWILLLFWA